MPIDRRQIAGSLRRDSALSRFEAPSAPEPPGAPGGWGICKDMQLVSRRALLPRLGAFGMASAAGVVSRGRPAASDAPRYDVRTPLARFPELFGSREVATDGLLARLPRAAVLGRSLAANLHVLVARRAGGDTMARAWTDPPAALEGVPPFLQLLAVNRLVNRARYVPDSRNHRVADHWATPRELFVRGGDCEDFAIAKFVALYRLGFHESRIRVALVFDTVRRQPHAVLLACPDDALYVLDNQSRSVMPATAISHYSPICSFDTRHLWLHRL